jgi:hypothetical protein
MAYVFEKIKPLLKKSQQKIFAMQFEDLALAEARSYRREARASIQTNPSKGSRHRAQQCFALGCRWEFRKKKGGLGGRPKFFSVFQSDVDDRNDPVVAVDDDDLIANDEVHVPAPLGMDFDERGGNLHHPNAGWHCGADAEGEVDVIDPRRVPAGQDSLSDLRALLRCQVHATARLALLRLTLLSLPLLRSLAWLSLTWLTGLALLRRLTCLALLTLLSLRSLARALIPLLLRLPLLALLRRRLGLLALGL